MTEEIKNLKTIYSEIRPQIEKRIVEFKNIWENGTDQDVFYELVFCIMTPQSKAKSCGKAVEILKEKNLILSGSAEEIAEQINIVRFRNNKARYIVNARDILSENGKIQLKKKLLKSGSPSEMRNWVIKNIKGIGYKEASHFLRNIGFGDSIAILDRHILKNMRNLSIIKEIPKSLNSKVYINLEHKLLDFSRKISIPADHLDFILWYKEAGDVYK